MYKAHSRLKKTTICTISMKHYSKRCTRIILCSFLPLDYFNLNLTYWTFLNICHINLTLTLTQNTKESLCITVWGTPMADLAYGPVMKVSQYYLNIFAALWVFVTTFLEKNNMLSYAMVNNYLLMNAGHRNVIIWWTVVSENNTTWTFPVAAASHKKPSTGKTQVDFYYEIATRNVMLSTPLLVCNIVSMTEQHHKEIQLWGNMPSS